jgi:hypothetical protein
MFLSYQAPDFHCPAHAQPPTGQRARRY